MNIITNIEEKNATCGNWPANVIHDVRTARNRLWDLGCLGGKVYLVGHTEVISYLRSTPLANSGNSYVDFMLRNKIIDDCYEIRYGGIDLPRDSVLVYSYKVDLSKYPQVEIKFHGIEITRVFLT